MMVRLKKRLQPLCYLENGRLLAYRFSVFYILDATHFSIIQKYSVNLGFKEKYLSRIKLIYRFLRLGIRNATLINREVVAVFVNKQFYELNLSKMELIAGFVPEPGVRALNISAINDIAGFDNMLVFGGYLSNPEKKSVHIYKRTDIDNWEIIYTFPAGTINHIHNIIPDAENSCVWIFTGDFDKAAAIWQATDNFSKVECVFSDNQMYRGCVAFPLNQGILYATDAPFAQNAIRFLKKENNKWTSELISDINGSCIYGCKVNDQYVFSTAVEPNGRNMNVLRCLFSWKRGEGIKHPYSYIYAGNMNAGFRIIYQVRKDSWPFIFQFGVLKFPGEMNNTNYVIAEHIATRKYDCSAVAIPLS